jgi:hypothetical protein
MITLILIYVLNGLTGTIELTGFNSIAHCQNKADNLTFSIQRDGGTVTELSCKRG